MKMAEQTTVLVLGSKGYIGSRILQQLKKEQSAFKVVEDGREYDLLELQQVQKLYDKQHIDEVIVAAGVGNRASDRDSMWAMMENIQITANVLYTFGGNCNIVYLGTGLDDKYEGSYYQRVKHICRLMTADLCKNEGLGDVTHVRLFHVYGPNEPKYRLIPFIVNQINTKGVVNLERNICIDPLHVDEICKTICNYVRRGHDKVQNVWNVGTGTGTLISDLAKQIAVIMGKPETPIICNPYCVSHHNYVPEGPYLNQRELQPEEHIWLEEALPEIVTSYTKTYHE